MIGNRMRAFALWTAFAIICSAPPALAAQFDGNWTMVAVTTSGHCGVIPIDVGIRRGRIYSTGRIAFGTPFARYPIELGGRLSASGQAPWLVRASLMEPEDSIGFAGAGRGPVPDRLASARAFGAPVALKGFSCPACCNRYRVAVGQLLHCCANHGADGSR